MLSTGAFNALLKTLEEPPAHVIFILATTEPQKLPVTILSRCQRFNFKKISISNISATLLKCAKKLNIEIEENAINLIARMADGAMRDAYSILDRCIADGESKITESKVRELVGIPEFEYLYEFTNLIINGETGKLIDFMERIINEGKSTEVFLAETIKFIRDILVFKTTNDIEGFSEQEKSRMQELANSIDLQSLIEIITSLAMVQGEMKWNSDSEVAFETGVLKVTLSKQEISKEKTNDMGGIDSLKNQVLTKLKENSKIRICAILQNSKIIEAQDGLIHIVFSSSLDDTNKQYLQYDETKIAIKEAVISATQKDYKVKYVFEK